MENKHPYIDNIFEYVQSAFFTTKKPDYFIGCHYSGTRFILFFFDEYVVRLNESERSDFVVFFPNKKPDLSCQVLISPVSFDVALETFGEKYMYFARLTVCWLNRWGSNMKLECYAPDNPCEMIQRLATMYNVHNIKNRNDEKIRQHNGENSKRDTQPYSEVRGMRKRFCGMRPWSSRRGMGRFCS